MIRPRPPPNRPWTVDGARARSRVAPPPVAPLPHAGTTPTAFKSPCRLTRWLRSANDATPRGAPTMRRSVCRQLGAVPAGPVGEATGGDADGGLASAVQSEATRRAATGLRGHPRRRSRARKSAPTTERARHPREGNARADRRRGLEDRATLGQAWVTDRIRNPQCAFEMSMFMCPAVHMSTRILRRSSSTHVPSDPPFGVVLAVGRRAPGSPHSRRPRGQHSHDDTRYDGRPHLFDLWLSVFVWVRFGERARTRAQAFATGVCTANSFKTWALPREGARRYRYRD